MAVLKYDEEAAKKLLAVYTTPDVERQRLEFLDAINLKEKEIVLDVGSGPGFLSRSMAKKVGPNGIVWGIEISEFFIDLAKSKNKDMPSIGFKYGDATDTGFSGEEFDKVVCTQVLEYVQDVDAALIEFNRVLKKGGEVCLLDTDWDSIVWNHSDAVKMSKILKAWESHATDPFLPRTLGSKLIQAGFKVKKVKVIPIFNSCYDQHTYSNKMIDLIVEYVVKNGLIKQENAESWAKELRNQENYFFSLNRYLFIGVKI